MNTPLIVFTDFDGVLHRLGTATWNGLEFKALGAFAWWPALRAVIEAHPAPVRLVIHSTWRLMWETDAELFAHLPADMVAYVQGVTPRDVMARQASIEAYCLRNRIDRFVVLDDEEAAFSPEWSPLVVCDAGTGIGDAGAQARLRRQLAKALAPQAV